MKLFVFSLCLLFCSTIVFSQTVKHESIPDKYLPYLYADEADMGWFEEAKYGVFVHWEPSSLAEVPISWGRFGPRPGAGRQAESGVPKEEYDNLYKSLIPLNLMPMNGLKW